MRKFLAAILTLTLALALGACSQQEQKTEAQPAAQTEQPAAAQPTEAQTDDAAAATEAKEPIRMGFGGALLGNLASYGLSGLYGLEFAVEEINSKGGLLGREVVIVKEDDGCDPALASSAATKLAGEGLNMIHGHTCSGATRSALSVYGNNVLVISPSATENSLTDDGAYPYFFRTTPRDDVQISLQNALIKQLGLKKIAILHDKGDYGKALADQLQAAVANNPDVEVVMFEGVTTGQVSYDSVIAKLKNSGAEAVVWGGYYHDGSKLVGQMRDKKLDTIVIGADGLKNDGYLNMAGPAAEGTYATGQVDLTANPMAAAAVEDHRKRYPTEEYGPYFFYAAGAAQALFAAIEKVGNTTDLEAIKKCLQEDSVETVMGPTRFDAKGDVIGAGFKMYQVKDGAYIEVPL